MTLRFGESVVDLVMTDDRRPRVCGVRTGTSTLPARLVIDASGIHTQMRRTTEGSGADCVSAQSHLYYTSRPLRLTRRGYDVANGAGAVWIRSPTPSVVHVRLFLHDAPYASILLVLHGAGRAPDRKTIEEAYQAVLSDHNVQQYCQGAECLAPIETIGFLTARLRLLDPETSFQPAGLYRIGDALAKVNPLTSRGASLGLIQSEALAASIARNASDYRRQCEDLLKVYDEWVVPSWADGVIRDNFLGPDLILPDSVAKAVDLARRRWRTVQYCVAQGRDSSFASRGREVATRVAQLLVPASSIDNLTDRVL